MFWSEDEPDVAATGADEIVDILFSIDCRSIPVDHADPLSAAIRSRAPWIAEEPLVGIHSIHVAGSQNGWERPEHGTGSTLMVSKRTKLTIRAPRTRASELISALTGSQLEIAGHHLGIGPGKIKSLSRETTIFARYVASGAGDEPEQSEEHFLQNAARALAEMGVQIRKALCGKTTALQATSGVIHTRSLMLSGLTKDESMRLQQLGLGPHRLMGCGIFIPHKGIDPVKKPA